MKKGLNNKRNTRSGVAGTAQPEEEEIAQKLQVRQTNEAM